MSCSPHVSSVPARELESLEDVSHHGIGEADGTDLHPLPQSEPRSILIFLQTDLWIHLYKPGRHRGKVQGDGP